MATKIAWAVLMYDFTFSASSAEGVQAAMGTPIHEGQGTVGTVKKRAWPTFHLGHVSCVHYCISMSLYV